MRSEFHRHQFRTDGCDITLVSDEADKVIESVEIDIAPSCNLSLKSVLNVSEGQPDIKLGDLTFGGFEPLLDSRYYADCLTLCGNAADPWCIWRPGLAPDPLHQLLGAGPHG